MKQTLARECQCGRPRGGPHARNVGDRYVDTLSCSCRVSGVSASQASGGLGARSAWTVRSRERPARGGAGGMRGLAPR
eukprot:4759221-Prymnesium_polylepis.1